MKKDRSKKGIGKTVKDGLLEGLTAAVLGWLLEKVKGWFAARAASGTGYREGETEAQGSRPEAQEENNNHKNEEEDGKRERKNI